jgi:hypothetical protein
MDKWPFDPYDFFGYLASGLLIIVGMDLVVGIPKVLGHDLKPVESAVLVLAIYVLGQIVATPAKAILEDVVVGRILGRPNVTLFGEKKPVLRAMIFPGFYAPLPSQTRQRILRKAESEGVKGVGEDLFLHVRYSPSTLRDQKLMDKLGGFLNKYGFNRNLSFASVIVGVALLAKAKFMPVAVDPQTVRYGVIALVAGALLFYRYLKFFRQYSYEMFNTYGRAQS